MWHVWGAGEVHTGFWWGDLRERDHLEDLRVDWEIILQLIFKKWDGGTDKIDLAQDRTGECLCSMKCREFLDCLRTG